MKEILFRAKSGQTWCYGYVHKDYESPMPNKWRLTTAYGDVKVINSDTIGEWTGLLDKNNVMIFEGDIVKKRTRHGMKNLPVTFSFGCFHCGFGSGSSTATHPYTLDDKQIEVKGNIYDNPELIKEES